MTLHPQSQAFLEAVRAADAPAWYEMPVDVARQTFSQLPVFGDQPDVHQVEDRTMAGVPVRVYRHGDQVADVMVYFHGGGWVLGDIETHDALCRRICRAAEMTVISVDYRRPPEHPFPAAVDDAYAVCLELSSHPDLRGGKGKVLVAGDSAGGNLAAAVSLMARERGGPQIDGQVLIYPVLDASMSTESYKRLAEGFGLTRATMSWFWQMYVGDVDSESRCNPLASPMAASDLSGLPPTHVLTAEYDVLRDEGIEMVRRLRESGVDASHDEQAGLLHGFIHFAGAFDVATAATERLGRRCRELLQR